MTTSMYGRDFFISAIDFYDTNIHGAIKQFGDTTGIFVNSEIPEEEQDETQDHELCHLALDHVFQKDKSSSEKEIEVEEYNA